MQLTFLNAPVPLTKTYTKLPSGEIEKSSYPNVFEVTSIIEECADLAEFEALINKHAAVGNCLLKGMVMRDLRRESRKDSTDRNATTEFICLDIDGINPEFTRTVDGVDFPPVKVTIDFILEAMGLGNISYLLQWSGSMGIGGNTLRCHIFMMLSKAVSAPLIKQWLIQKNHEVAVLRAHQALTKTGTALTWGLDITACQADKLIYIAPPVLKGIKNPLGKLQRVQLVNKAQSAFTLNEKINTTDQNRALTDARVLELRDVEGLPKRKLAYKVVGPHEIMIKPGECIVTGMKQDRGFVYFNLNGGDSWGYFHPEDNPDYIFNFKGEPTYLTKELLPQYWESLNTQAYRVSSTGVIYLAFLDRGTDTYYRGEYYQQEDVLTISPTKRESVVRQFADAAGMRLGNNIPEWTMKFDPHNDVRVDFDNRVVNTFVRTDYMKRGVKRKVGPCPTKINTIIQHVLNNDTEAIEHFLNWLAVIVQNRTMTRTAWVFQGTHGTGKGILFERVLAPLFGIGQTVIKRAEELTERWTDFVEGKFLVFIDEIETHALKNSSGVISNMKSLIANKDASIRVMNKNAFAVPNFSNWIFASNMSEPITIPKGDRRFNIGPRQDRPFPLPTDEWLDSISPRNPAPGEVTKELLAFYDFLLSYPASIPQASTPLRNEARDHLIALSMTTSESTADALKTGDLTYFVNQLPTNDDYKSDAKVMTKVETYRRTLFDIFTRIKGDFCSVSRDELFVMFDYSVGNMNLSPASFTKFLGHRQLEIKPVSVNGKTVRGIPITWTGVDTLPTVLKVYFQDMRIKA